MAEGKVTLRVFRFQPGVDATPRYQDYELPWSQGLSMLEAVRYIYNNLDRTLAFRNYHCGRGLCRVCLWRIDGQTQRGCYFIVQSGAVHTVEPPDGYPIIRDLMVDFGTPLRHGDEREMFWVKEGAIVTGATAEAGG